MRRRTFLSCASLVAVTFFALHADAFLSTSGSFTLSSGGSGNTGNSEDIEEQHEDIENNIEVEEVGGSRAAGDGNSEDMAW